MMTVKIMSEREGRHDEFLGVVVVPVSRIMSGEQCCDTLVRSFDLEGSYSRMPVLDVQST